ncbi:MAG TPA: hypothetical protein PL009_14525 [Flavipsychrobacter sp.]|nr:hypothetical protein [Flavipsychrobacter sp.]
MRSLLFVAIISMGFIACNKENSKGNNPPQISFISLSPEEFKNGTQTDTIRINFEFSDKDGDVGSTGEINEAPNVIIRQTYDSSSGEAKLPIIPPGFQDPENGIKGTASIAIPAIFYTLDSTHLQTGDTFHFEIQIKDKAGNLSNSITTSDVYIKP